MARHLRLEYEGAIYHITARGNERTDIFSEDRDNERFLEKLGELVERHHDRVLIRMCTWSVFARRSV